MDISAVGKSPLAHFFLIGALLFGLYSLLSDSPAAPRPDAIVVTAEDAARLVERFNATWRRPPTEEDLEKLMRELALEEAYVREALALGLDQDDTVIRQRLRMKMQFLAEAGAATLTADDKTLAAFLDANRERFERPPRTAFKQILLDDAAEADGVKAKLAAGAAPATLGVPSLLPNSLSHQPGPVIDGQFGEGFHDSLTKLPEKVWSGPVTSGYGAHLVRVQERLPARLPPLAEIRDRVEAEWRAEANREQRAAFAEAMLQRYTVEMPDANEVLSP